MPSEKVAATLMDFGETLSCNNLAWKCAPEVYLNTVKRHAILRALLFFTIPNFRTGGRAGNAPDCKSGVHRGHRRFDSFSVHHKIFHCRSVR